MECQVLDTGAAPAAQNMRLDDDLLRGIASRQHPLLHLYEWEGNCATYGHFLDPDTLLHKEVAQRYHLQLARRPTGGGLCFHLTDFTYSLLIPSTHPAYSVNTLENYAFVSRIIANVVQKFLRIKNPPSLLSQDVKALKGDHFCMARPTPYDVMVDGRKVGGAAQRRTKDGFLHQGTISITLPSQDYLLPLLKHPSIWEAMQQYSYLLLSFSRPTGNSLCEDGVRNGCDAPEMCEESEHLAASIHAIRRELRKLLVEEVLNYC